MLQARDTQFFIWKSFLSDVIAPSIYLAVPQLGQILIILIIDFLTHWLDIFNSIRKIKLYFSKSQKFRQYTN